MRYDYIEKEFVDALAAIVQDPGNAVKKLFSERGVEVYQGQFDGFQLPEDFNRAGLFALVQCQGTTYDRSARMRLLNKGDIGVAVYIGSQANSTRIAKVEVYRALEQVKQELAGKTLTVKGEELGVIRLSSDNPMFILPSHVSFVLNLIISNNKQYNDGQ